jgi:hypothetical protein
MPYAACLRYVFAAHGQLRETHSTGPSSSHPATSSATPNGRLCTHEAGWSSPGRRTDIIHGILSTTTTSAGPAALLTMTYHATFLVVLAKLQCQIAERLRARLHRHGLVVGEAVLLRGRRQKVLKESFSWFRLQQAIATQLLTFTSYWCLWHSLAWTAGNAPVWHCGHDLQACAHLL